MPIFAVADVVDSGKLDESLTWALNSMISDSAVDNVYEVFGEHTNPATVKRIHFQLTDGVPNGPSIAPVYSTRNQMTSGEVEIHSYTRQSLDNGYTRFTLSFTAPAGFQMQIFSPPSGRIFMIRSIGETTSKETTVQFDIKNSDLAALTTEFTIGYYSFDIPGEFWIFTFDACPTEATVSGGKYELDNNTMEATFIAPEKEESSNLTIPATVTIDGYPYKVTGIAANAFKSMSKLTKVIIGKNVTTIGNNAFSGCKTLKTVKGMAGVNSFGDGAFQKCAELAKITITKGVTQIGKNAFNGCSKLKTITIKATKLKSIGKNAFSGIMETAIFKCRRVRLMRIRS